MILRRCLDKALSCHQMHLLVSGQPCSRRPSQLCGELCLAVISNTSGPIGTTLKLKAPAGLLGARHWGSLYMNDRWCGDETQTAWVRSWLYSLPLGDGGHAI